MGAFDQAARAAAADAAVAHQPRVGVQKFKNDMSLTDEQIDTIVKWVDAGAPQGNPADFPALKLVSNALYWQAERDGYGPPDLVVKSAEYTMPAVSQDQWWRPLVEIPNLTEPRWVRMVEIRPSNLQGRKILHHSIAYHVLSPDNVQADQHRRRRQPLRHRRRNTDSRRCRQSPSAVDGMGDRQRLRPLHGWHR
ncbi:MAG: hypothetical protein QM736_10410 [Vicinamibacterales bacterium]